ncbi:MAG: hypothetical protein EP343_02420 [Deltaproteobacteria bacterium]|nr:MAG: hypothetical protein EP343_02420 [Deltaproteobacteria bacterium]
MGRHGRRASALYARQRNNTEAFYQGRDGYLHYSYYHAPQKRWMVDSYSFRKGGKVLGALSAAYSNKRRHAEVFYQGVDGKYRHFYIGKRGWTVKVLSQ